uniref:Type VII secretion system protein EssD-like domain-containing protein n=1 Tax=Panagrolaimus davidi TaxID=227884 RepID=A0A914P0M2_9BILA
MVNPQPKINVVTHHSVDKTTPVKKTNGGFVPNVSHDSQGRIRYAYGSVVRDGSVNGTPVSSSARTQVRANAANADDICHIIPNSMGGSGQDIHNLYPGNRNMNRGMDAQLDMTLSQFDRVDFSMEFFYEGSNRRPIGYSLVRTVFTRESVAFGYGTRWVTFCKS